MIEIGPNLAQALCVLGVCAFFAFVVWVVGRDTR